MTPQHIDHLDAVAERVARGDREAAAALSTGEQLYVALAANDMTLLASNQYTIAGALGRLGDEWVRELVTRWEYRRISPSQPEHT